ncbi:glycosyl hydrolase family 88 [Alistipes sp. An116]|uniref:glycoside hydrolase family 88/105 protein n=1 Tax=Alistipes sp. An116 TaxID=1965546 RepID=UPI000B3ABA23|nr:glycoside hydrolase family 88 protein [Alistipes sp. An116]OUQ52894.1 glycosyl hydrolase family 88 [Alistipes sp. An116]
MKRLLIAVAVLGMAACSSGSGALYDSPVSLAVRMAESEIARNPSPAMLDGIPAGKVKWNYTTGLELLAIRDAGEAWNRPDFIAYADRYYDTIVQADGSVLTYSRAKYNLDHICPGRALFSLYNRTGEQRYAQVLDTLYAQLRAQPRNFDGGFWHKAVYPHQMWLDGLYMAEPFYAEYAMTHLTGAALDDAVADIVNQFVTVGKHTWDPATGLYRHAYDDSREMFWCDSISGQSAHAWCRAMGWYAMAIVETMQYLGKNDATRPMQAILERIYDVLPKYADPRTGMWYQVLDQPGREGNYLESTGSVMFVYAQLKAVRLGYLPEEMREEALHRYEQFVDRFIRENADGTISMTDCCAVAGLGGKQRRSGTFEYYISEPVIENDCKGVGPFIWASLEYDRAKGRL